MYKPLIAILLFEDVEVLDFAGPFEVFSVTAQLSGYHSLEVKTVAKTKSLIRAKNGLQVIPDLEIAELRAVDILVLPGGDGSKTVIQDTELMEWIGQMAKNAQTVFSVCSGARILAKLGFLKGQHFTTHHEVFEDILAIEPTALTDKNPRFVDNGKFMTAAGVAAGIDLSLHVVEKYFGKRVKERTARYMEYGDH
jgi:transcriptional regulator GlxA family with amidase domain